MSDPSVLDQPLEGAAAWRGPQLCEARSWLHHLTSADVEELETALAGVRRKGCAFLGRRPDLARLYFRSRSTEPGDMQFVKDATILHSRTEHEDSTNPSASGTCSGCG